MADLTIGAEVVRDGNGNPVANGVQVYTDPNRSNQKGAVVAVVLGDGTILTLGQATAANSLPVAIASDQAALPTISRNVVNKFREAFEAYAPGDRWAETLGAGDIITVDGNTASASYLVISKNPLAAGTESRVQTIPTFSMPFDAALGLHMSQRTLGQEFSVEFVSTESPLSTPADVAVASISQATTTLSVTTATPHGLFPGMRIGIRDCVDPRVNYPSLVVATVPTPTTFTATAGPGGTIPSVTAGPFTSGSVYFRSAMGLAPNGTSMIFENANATNASFYVRSERGDVLPSGTIAGNHTVTTLSTASAQPVNTVGSYSFQPTNEFRLAAFVSGVQWSDCVVDTLLAANNRMKRTQVVPDTAHDYVLRVRATNNAALTRPTAQIVSATKTGTTTATIVTATAHGLTTADLVVVYGIRDQAASSFPNLLTATAVASIVNATTFTIVIGTAATVTSYGGYMARVNGGNLMSSLGAIAQVIQSAVRTSNVLTLVGSAAWAGLLIGDYVNIVGVRDNVSGASLGIDGAYRVRDVVTTTLVLEQINSTVSPGGTDIVLTNCGGAVIKRTDLRISFVRVLDFERQRVEVLPRPQGDVSEAASVNVQNSPAVTVSSGTVTTVTTVSTVSAVTGGGVAEDAAAGANPVVTGGVVRTAAAPTTLVAGDAVRDTHAGSGAKIVKPFSVPEAGWNANVSLTSTTAAPLAAAAGAGLKRHITALQAINTGASAVDLILLDGATERWRLTLPVNIPVAFEFPTELATTANAALNANLSAVGTVRCNAQGYTSS